MDEKLICVLILILIGFVKQSEQSCKVLSQCDKDDVMTWENWPSNVEPETSDHTNDLMQASNEGPKLHYFSNTVTWDTGKAYCNAFDKRLCYERELCVTHDDGGTEFLFDVIPGDNWVPVLDSHNEWVEAGDSGRRTCLVHSKHYSKPAWGTSTSASPYKGFIFCCTKDPQPTNHTEIEEIKYQYIGKTATYAKSKQHCENQGRRLCQSDEVCQNNLPIFGVIHGDMWVAVSDKANEWVEIGDSAKRTCWIHGPHHGLAAWGIREDNSSIEYNGYVYCCQKK